MTIHCRRATASDTAALLEVHRAAFSGEVEADLVASLLSAQDAQPCESWVADVDGSVVGHVLLTPGTAAGQHVPPLLLCPLAVLPSHQHAGVGTAVTNAALGSAADAGITVVSVLGDPDYYSRFGFRSLLESGPLPPYDIAEAHRDAWQTLTLNGQPPNALDGIRIQWAEPLMTPALWQS